MAKLKAKKQKEFAVLGLGHFGMRAAEVLAVDYGVNVLVCDNDPYKVQHASSFATQAIQMDVSNEDEIERLGLGNFDVVIIATGDDFEAALTATTVAREKGAPHIIVKAETRRQKNILEKLGANRVVFPERETGEKIARGLLNPDIIGILNGADNFAATEMEPLKDWIGKSVAESNIRAEYGAMILAIRREYKNIVPVRSDEILQPGDILLVWKENG